MEWVETTGKTVEEAKERALDRLGVAEDEAEFEILEEPRPGFLGMRRGEARVRARVRPSQPRPKVDRRERGRRDRKKRNGERSGQEVAMTSSGSEQARQGTEETAGRPAGGESRPSAPSAPAGREPREEAEVLSHEEHAAIVRKFVEGLVAAFGMEAEVATSTTDEETIVEVRGRNIGLLIGPEGRTAEAIGDLSRSVVLRQADGLETEGRVVVDVGGLRERRRAALERFAREMAEAVQRDGRARVLEPMNSADRKIVHDALVDVDGVQTLSEGSDPERRVVIAPA